MPKIIASLGLGILAIVVITAGCGGSGQAEPRIGATAALEAGIQSLEGGDFQAAIESFEYALESGLLNADSTVECLIQRAIAQAAGGDLESALADLHRAEQGPSDLAKIFAVRSFVLEKQGKRAEANAAWVQAQRINRKIQKISL
jgi:Tfp pilus assembly protein PilF